jgi:hypothetical protein
LVFKAGKLHAGRNMATIMAPYYGYNIWLKHMATTVAPYCYLAATFFGHLPVKVRNVNNVNLLRNLLRKILVEERIL